jgi:uncharacterized protein (DUF1684 family)
VRAPRGRGQAPRLSTGTAQTRGVDDYVAQVEGMRRAKDEAFRNDPGSPIPDSERKSFKGLRYYRPDPRWRFRVRLVPHDEPREAVMQASDGQIKRYLDVGRFDLPISGAIVPIHAYVSAAPAHRGEHGHESGETHAHGAGHGHGGDHDHWHAPLLFIPFRDRTSGKETYGAGRYLEVEPVDPHDDEYVIDFNLAYNPSCAYDEAFSCPFPPVENWLQVAIEAGERTYE